MSHGVRIHIRAKAATDTSEWESKEDDEVNARLRSALAR